MPYSCFVENCSNNTNLQPNLNFYIFPSNKQGYHLRWLQAIGQATATSKFLHSSLVDQHM